MKLTHITIDGREYPLCLNGAALFDIYAKFGDKNAVVSHVEGSDRKAFYNTCWILAKLCEQGELVRRYQGFAPAEIPTENQFRLLMGPLDVLAAKSAIRRAVAIGFGREVQEEQEKRVDLGLLDLQKKTEPACAGRSICRWLRNFWGWMCGKECS